MALSTSDVQVLEESLAAGKHPKVVFTDAAGQIAGRVGKVMRLEEPAEGEFVTVRFGNDELPFSAADVRIPERGELSRSARKPAPETPPGDAPPRGAPLLSARDNGGDKPADGPTKRGAMSDEVSTAVPNQGTAAPEAPKPAPRRKAAGKAKAGPELTVSLVFKDDEWSVSAAKGSKVIARPVPVKASTAVDMVRSLESPAVAAVVEEIVEQTRVAAEEQAERLRRELANVEARLAELT